jgi:hypothetical protein
MDDYIFLNRNKLPGKNELKELAPVSSRFLDEIRNHLSDSGLSITEEWKYYTKNTGWTKKFLIGKRNLLFFTPIRSGAIISFVFGDKAVDEVNKSSLPDRIKEELNSAKKYAEGRGVRIKGKSNKDLKNVLGLLDIKIRIK